MGRHIIGSSNVIRPELAAKWLARKLDLTKKQAEKVRAILREQQAAFVRVRRDVAPQVVEHLCQTDQRITKILTPMQRERWHAVVERLRRNWLPPDMQKE